MRPLTILLVCLISSVFAYGLSRGQDEVVTIRASFQLPIVGGAVVDKTVAANSSKASPPIYFDIKNISKNPIVIFFNSEQPLVEFSEKDIVIKHPQGYPFVSADFAAYPYPLKAGQTFISYFDAGKFVEFDKNKKLTLDFTVPVQWDSPTPQAGAGRWVRKEIRMEYVPR